MTSRVTPASRPQSTKTGPTPAPTVSDSRAFATNPFGLSVDGGRQVFRGTTTELAEAGDGGNHPGDSSIERGYSALLAQHGRSAGAW
ncbi:hypothetical protein [Saccharopolyspora soli]|uniref:hypothetical protein n=1 Tax=Saccharopolyspora soli TaxID=2926618 RepID=UPI001F59E64B|nr:hypothetical protein [Saccharopolyspora soli]